MRKSCCIILAVLLILSAINVSAYNTDIPVNFVVNGKAVNFNPKPIIRDGVTYVDLKALAGKLSLTYTTYDGHESYVVSNSRKSICFVPYEEYATVSDLTGKLDSEFQYRVLTAPCIYISNRPFVAARDLATVFGYALKFNVDTNTVYFGYSPDMISADVIANAESLAYYFQNQSDFNLPSYGSGYCWTCSYAMLITNVTGIQVTPADIAAINSANGGSGAYCYHLAITNEYNLKFVNALPTGSIYYGGRDKGSGGTYINNPARDDAVAIAALKEALTMHPEGVMVRYADFPHTMVAVGFDGDIILFNDPAPSGSGTYASTGRYHAVPFSETCVAMKGFALADLTFIQAIGY